MYTKKTKNFLIIDGNFCLYKNYYSIPILTNKKGEYTNAIYGFIKTINQLIKKLNLNNIIITFDSSKNTFRHKLYKFYKKNRKSMPINLFKQIKPLQKILLNMGIPIFQIKNIEADDIIGTLTKNLKKYNIKIFIYSSDKDMIQLIQKNVFLIKKNNIINEQYIYEKYGFYPKLMLDFLSLTGDISDNIPGVKGIGKKTATILLKKFNSIEEIYKNIKDIEYMSIHNKKKIIHCLKQYKSDAFLSKKIISIKKNINLNINYKNIFFLNPNKKLVLKKFEYFQFYEYLNKIKENRFPIFNMLNR